MPAFAKTNLRLAAIVAILNRIFYLPSEELACTNSYQTYSCAGVSTPLGPPAICKSLAINLLGTRGAGSTFLWSRSLENDEFTRKNRVSFNLTLPHPEDSWNNGQRRIQAFVRDFPFSSFSSRPVLHFDQRDSGSVA